MAGEMAKKGMCGKGGVCMTKRGCMAKGGACVAGETATVAGSTHPTGMHSCVCHFRGDHTSFLTAILCILGFFYS